MIGTDDLKSTVTSRREPPVKPSLITTVNVNDEGHLHDLLHSSESSAAESRGALVSRLKQGERLIAAVPGQPARAIVLRSAIEPSHKGKPSGDDLVLVPFA
jgi:hypothetical protein